MTVRIINRAAVTLSALLIFISFANGEDNKGLSFTRQFFYEFARSPLISRDSQLESMMNGMVSGRGRVVKVEKAGRYRKQFRITAVDEASQKYNLGLRYYVFLNNEDSATGIKEGSVFEFRGQLAAYTPLNTLRSEYIFDIILEEGALVIE